jgi:hypothetical protein
MHEILVCCRDRLARVWLSVRKGMDLEAQGREEELVGDDKTQLNPDDTLQRDEKDLTPPHGDDLRSEETFGRTDRYSNVDDATAARSEPDRGASGAPATNTGETLGGATANVIGRGGDTIVQDDLTPGRPTEGKEPGVVDRKAP